MTREKQRTVLLVYRIKDNCYEVAENLLKEHDRQIRAEVLGKIFNAIKENTIICNDGETEIVELVNIVKCIEQLKEQR